MPGSPEHRIEKGADLADAFREAYQDEVRALRHRTMRRAADLALGDDARAWFSAIQINGEEDRALGSDAALIKRLKELQDAYDNRAGRWRMPANLVRFSSRALMATIRVLPDMEIAATSGLSTNGYSTPAASGKAIAL